MAVSSPTQRFAPIHESTLPIPRAIAWYNLVTNNRIANNDDREE